MNTIKWLTLTLTAVAFTAPAFAQTDPHANEKWKNGKLISAKLERAAVKAVKQHRSAVCPQCGNAYSMDELYHNVAHKCPANANQPAQTPACVRCGEPIRKGQHCKAVGYTQLCTSATEWNQKAIYQQLQEQTKSDFCSKCGKKYSMDERYHGVLHRCTAQEATQENNQTEAVYLKVTEDMPSTCPECGKEYSIDELYHNVAHRCNGAEKTIQQDASSYCPECGKEYSIDELYHNVAHRCNGTEKGVQQPAKTYLKVSQETPSHCPDCGAEYSIDELYHNVAHRCSK